MDMNNQVNNAGSGEPQVHERYDFILFANYSVNLQQQKLYFCKANYEQRDLLPHPCRPSLPVVFWEG